jgi:HAD superfamily hydrolase (TIGR01509 family)
MNNGIPKALLCDVDGTLINSIPYHNESFMQLFRDLGLRFSKRKIMTVMRMPSEEIYTRLRVKKLTGLNLKSFITIRRNYYYRLIEDRDIVFDRVYETLDLLKSYKMKLAIATNSSRKTTRKQVPRKLKRYFKVVLTYDDVEEGKPDPQMLTLALRKLRVQAKDSIFVGDSKYDVVAANELNIKFIGVTTGVSTRKNLEENGAYEVVKRFSDIDEIIIPR